jgi:transposase, IS30 family
VFRLKRFAPSEHVRAGENANGRLRRWPPHQIAIDKVSDEEVITANLTPRKCLGFKTPFQEILKELGKGVPIRFA